MKKIYFVLLFSIFFQILLHAQISLSQNDIRPNIGDTIIFEENLSFSGAMPAANTSSNVVWDYSNSTGFSPVDTSVFLDTSIVSGINNLFPSAEFVLATIGSSVYGLFSYSNELSYLGYISNGDTSIYSTPLTYTPFPINNSINITNSPFAFSGNNLSSGGTRDIQFYGGGTLTLPNGVSYSNTVLLRIDHTDNSSTITDYTEYAWYVSGCPLPIMSIFNFNGLIAAGYRNNIPSNLLTHTPVLKNVNQKIKLYPNPISDFLHIESDTDILKVVVRSINGKEMLTEHNPKNYLNLNRLHNGVYSMEIETNNGILTKKIIKK